MVGGLFNTPRMFVIHVSDLYMLLYMKLRDDCQHQKMYFTALCKKKRLRSDCAAAQSDKCLLLFVEDPEDPKSINEMLQSWIRLEKPTLSESGRLHLYASRKVYFLCHG